MPKAKTEAQYKEWVKEVEASLASSEQKERFRALTDNSEEGMKVFGGYLRQQEFDRALNEVKDSEKAVKADRGALTEAIEKFKSDVVELNNWYQQELPKNQRMNEDLVRTRAMYDAANQKLRELGLEVEAPVSTPSSPASAGVSSELVRQVEFLAQRLARQDQALPRVLADAMAVTREGLKEGFDFDPSAVIARASARGVDVQTAFRELTADQREAKANAEREKEIEKAREEGRREAQSRYPSPERLRPSGPTIFDSLNAAPVSTDRRERVNEAVKEFIATGGDLS